MELAPTLAEATVPQGPAGPPTPTGQELAPPTMELPPPISNLAAGDLPALTLGPLDPNSPPDPVQLFVLQAFEQLPEIGIQFFETADKETVVYNSALISEEQLQEAEAAGTLYEIAPPSAMVMEALAAADPGEPPGPTSAVGTSVPPPAPMGPASGALSQARVNMPSGGPQVSPIQPNPIGAQMGRRAI